MSLRKSSGFIRSRFDVAGKQMIGLLFKSLPHKMATLSWSRDKMSIVRVRIASIPNDFFLLFSELKLT